MGNDINSLVSNYLKNNSNADIESVKQAFENLTMNSRDTSLSSIFDLDGFSGSMSEEEFLNLMSTATNKSADSIKDDVSILFDILDSEADGVGSLSKNELSQLASSSNTNSISSFSIWNKFLLFSEDEIAKSGSSGTKVDDSDRLFPL